MFNEILDALQVVQRHEQPAGGGEGEGGGQEGGQSPMALTHCSGELCPSLTEDAFVRR